MRLFKFSNLFSNQLLTLKVTFFSTSGNLTISLQLFCEVCILLLNVGGHDFCQGVSEFHLAFALALHVIVNLALHKEGHCLVLTLAELLDDLWMLHDVLRDDIVGSMVRAGEVHQLLGRYSYDFIGRVFTQELEVYTLTVILNPQTKIICRLASPIVFLALLTIVAATNTIIANFLFTFDTCFVPDLTTCYNSINQATQLEERDLSVLLR